MRVLVTDRAWPDLTVEQAVFEPLGITLVEPDGDDPAAMIALGPELDAILTCWRTVPPELLDAAPHCRIVSRYGIGLDNIPVARATEVGIVVTNVPDFCLHEVSDHAMALLLAAARRIVPFSGETAGGVWAPSVVAICRACAGRPSGLSDTATSGGRWRRRRWRSACALVHTPRLTPGPRDDGTVAVASLDELFSSADFVSLHLPATLETRGLIGEAALRVETDRLADQHQSRRAGRRAGAGPRPGRGFDRRSRARRAGNGAATCRTPAARPSQRDRDPARRVCVRRGRDGAPSPRRRARRTGPARRTPADRRQPGRANPPRPPRPARVKRDIT